MHRRAYRLSLIISVCAFVSLLVFTIWFISVVVPVLVVELQYQMTRVAKETFKVNSLSQLIVPNIVLRVDDTSRHAQNGGISIPSIYVDEPVIYNIDPNNKDIYSSALKSGIAHAAGTGLPGSGGLGYYFAHSSSVPLVRQYNAVFYLLGKLKPGDTVILWREDKRFPYTVTTTQITFPNDVSFLMKPYPQETVVLQTCWPPGTSLQRLLVFAEAP